MSNHPPNQGVDPAIDSGSEPTIIANGAQAPPQSRPVSSDAQHRPRTLQSVVPAIAPIGTTGLLPAESLTGSGLEAKALRDEVTSYIITSLLEPPLGETFNFRRPSNLIPYHLGSVRARNCFQQNRAIKTWADLTSYSVDDLLQTDNAGHKSVKILIDLALQEVLATVDTAVGSLTDATHHSTPAWIGSGDLETILEWTIATRATKTLGDALAVRADLGKLPADVADAWERLRSTELGQMVNTPSGNRPTALSLLTALTEREHTVFCRRNLAPGSPTLEEVGTEIGVTRERVRQLQQKAEKAVADAMEDESNRVVRWLVEDLRAQLGAALPDTMLDDVLPWDGSEEGATERRLLLWLAGPYVPSEGWLVRDATSLKEVWDVLETRLLTAEGLARTEAVAILGELGFVERAAEALLQDPKGMRVVGSELFPWTGSVADKAEVVLRLLGRPATDQDLVDHIGEGHARRSLRNRLMNEERFMRTDRDDFALRSWDLEEYSGISDEIAERIERAGGEAVLEQVVNELLDTFDVAESSIRQYAAAHRFVLSNGMIRLRADEEIVVTAADPITIPGVYRPSNDRLLVEFDVTSDTIRGSGRGIAQPIAMALGATPGKEVAFSWGGTDELRVVWRLESASGPAIGSLATVATRISAEVGDVLLADFNLAHRTARAHRVTPGELMATLRVVFGSAGDDVDLIAAALGVERGAVRAVLRRRGDGHVVEELPGAQVDESLKSALKGLTDLLGDLS